MSACARVETSFRHHPVRLRWWRVKIYGEGAVLLRELNPLLARPDGRGRKEDDSGSTNPPSLPRLTLV